MTRARFLARGEKMAVRVNRWLFLVAPPRYRKRLRELIDREGMRWAVAKLDLNESTVWKILAGGPVSRGSLARLMLTFDGPDAVEEFLSSSRRNPGVDPADDDSSIIGGAN